MRKAIFWVCAVSWLLAIGWVGWGAIFGTEDAPLQHRLSQDKPSRVVRVTMYYPTGRLTASGVRLRPGYHAAVSRAMETLFPLGSLIWVPGHPSKAPDRMWRVADRTAQDLPGLVIDLSQPRHVRPFLQTFVMREW